MNQAEAINKIEQLVNRANPVIQAPDFAATGRFYAREESGKLTTHFAARVPASTELFSTLDLVARTLADVAPGNPDEALADAAKVYYSADRITAELTAGEITRWRHTLRLPLHPAFQALDDLTKTVAFTQKSLIRFLRATLNGHVADHVVEEFRALKLTTDGETNSVMAKGREAVDKRIQQKVTATAGTEIPDEITVTVPVYDLDECRAAVYPITLLVEATTEDGGVVFEVTTVLNSLREAQRAALDELADALNLHLDGHDVPVYYGRA